MTARYDALTLDANVVIRDGFNFESGLLGQLRQFKDGPAEFIIPRVVFQEIYTHLLRTTRAAAEDLEAATAKAKKFGIINLSGAPAKEYPFEPLEPVTAAMGRLTAFGTNSGAQLVPHELAPVNDLMERYFQNLPPFATSGKKKQEFPDAVALLSLEAWARSTNKRVLAVSRDRGWKEFADTSEFLDVIEELSEALSIFQEDRAHAAKAVSDFLAAVEDGRRAHDWEEIESYVSDDIGSVVFDFDYESPFLVETDDTDFIVDCVEFARRDGAYDITIVRLGRTEIVAQIGLKLTVSVEAWFSLYPPEEEQEGAHPVGHASSRVSGPFEVDILLTLSRTDEQDMALRLEHLELVEDFLAVDFGTLLPESGVSREGKLEELPQLPFDDLPPQQPREPR